MDYCDILESNKVEPKVQTWFVLRSKRQEYDRQQLAENGHLLQRIQF